MADCYIAEIRLFAGNFAPQGWLLCDGSLYAISQFDALFSLIGTTYGGDGVSNFAVPDLRGTVAIGSGQGPGLTSRQLGSRGGSMDVTLAGNHTPSHSHGLSVSNATCPNPGLTDATGKTFGMETLVGSGRNIYGTGSDPVAMDSLTVSMDPASPAVPHDNAQPYQALTYIMAYSGIWPPRS